MNINFKVILLNITIMTTCALLAGCNTFEGMGKDLKQGGQALERAAGNNGTSVKKSSTTTPHITTSTTQTTTTPTTQGY